MSDDFSDDFALIDFAILAAPPERVVTALAQAHRIRAAPAGPPAAGAGSAPGPVARLFRRAPRPAAPPPLRLQPRADAPDAGPLRQADLDAPSRAGDDAVFRVSAPVGTAGRVMVEFREGADAVSPLCAALSAELPGVEVFRFRLSGARHPGSDTAFHVYLDGRAVRRVASFSPEGVVPEAPWRVVDVGMPHAVEADSLPGARARAWDVVTPPRLAAILAALDIDADRLFAPDPARRAVLLSPDPGGRPLAEAAARFAAGPGLRQPPALVAAAEAAQPTAPAPRLPPPPAAAQTHPPAPPQTPTRPPPPPPDAGSPRDADPTAAAAWEDEVTALLVAAASHGLPEAEQVPWLTRLAARMEAGEIDAALAEARHVLARGDRPDAERAADIARLDALFGAAGG